MNQEKSPIFGLLPIDTMSQFEDILYSLVKLIEISLSARPQQTFLQYYTLTYLLGVKLYDLTMPSYGLYRELWLSNKIGTIIMYTFFPRPNYIELSPWQSKAQGYVGEKYCTLVQERFIV